MNEMDGVSVREEGRGNGQAVGLVDRVRPVELLTSMTPRGVVHCSTHVCPLILVLCCCCCSSSSSSPPHPLLSSSSLSSPSYAFSPSPSLILLLLLPPPPPPPLLLLLVAVAIVVVADIPPYSLSLYPLTLVFPRGVIHGYFIRRASSAFPAARGPEVVIDFTDCARSAAA